MRKASDKPKHNKHIVYIDYLRVFSCISVIFLHIIVSWSEGQGLTVASYPTRLRIDTTIAEILRVAVPIFVMISGALLLDRDKTITWEKIFKYIRKMIIVLVTFGFMFAIMESSVNNGLNIKTIYLAFCNLLQEKTWGHMWYVYMLIGLYIITPIIKSFTDKSSKEDYRKAIILLSIPTVFIPSINWISGLQITTFGITGLIFPFLFILGQYINRYNIKQKKAYLLFIVSIISLALLGLFTDHHLTGSSYGSLPIVLLATSIFSIIKNVEPNNNIIVKTIANYSFGIYIIHVFFIHIIELVLKISLKNTPPVIGELSMTLTVFLLSTITVFALKKIPLINKII